MHDAFLRRIAEDRGWFAFYLGVNGYGMCIAYRYAFGSSHKVVLA